MAIQYGRNGSRSIDEAAIDESLEDAVALARRLSVQHLGPVKKISALTRKATKLGRRLWAR